jgi:hypothetical protein
MSFSLHIGPQRRGASEFLSLGAWSGNMLLTRFLKICGYLLAALFLFGVATQITRFGRPLSQQQAIDAQRKEFSDVLRRSQASPDAAQQLGAFHKQSLDDYGRVLVLASRFMAGACTVLVGLLSAVAFLWHRVRVLQALVPTNEAPNRVAGGVAAPGSHTTGHAGPRPAVPGSPDG